jgi:signal transduction histidine kinase
MSLDPQLEASLGLRQRESARPVIGVGIVDRELRFIEVDETLAAMHSLPAASHLGQHLAAVLPGLAPLIEPLLRHVLETGEPLREVELRGELWAGRAGRWLASYEPVRTRAGTILAIECVVRELDADGPDTALTTTQAALHSLAEQLAAERQRTEQALQAAEAERALLDTLLASAPIGINFVSRDLRFVRINDYLAQNNGLSVEQHLGRTVREVLPTLANTVEPLLQRVLETGQPITDIDVMGETPAAPGVPRIWRESLYPVFNSDGLVLGVGAIVAEITEHRRIGDALRESQERTAVLQTITAALAPALTPLQVAEAVLSHAVAALGARSGVVALIDSAGTGLEAIYAHGYPRADLPSWRWQLAERSPLGDAVREGRPILVHDRARAEQLYPELAGYRAGLPDVAWANLPLVAEQGVVGALGLGFGTPQEFTAEQQALLQAVAQQCAQALERARLYQAERTAREEAERAVRERDDLIALISHDLKNPLTVIQGQAQLMERRLGRGETLETARVERGLGLIREAAIRMAVQIEELLDVALLRAGRSLHLDPQPLDLVTIAERAFGLAQAHSESHVMRLLAPDTSLVCVCDGPRIERVLTNLLSNAVKYTPDGGAIELVVRSEMRDGQRWAALEVRDSGIGIPAADLPHIFERFHRAANTVGQIRGTGLGLASARQIVVQHGGTLDVQSTEGAGSVFTVRLPL